MPKYTHVPGCSSVFLSGRSKVIILIVQEGDLEAGGMASVSVHMPHCE